LEQTELSLTTRLAGALREYDAARTQVVNFQQRILPNAQESLRLVMLFYDRADPKYDYTAVLQAQSILAQARLAYVQALGDQQRAASAIEALLQRPIPEFFARAKP
jgi:outer membrane protein TolC